LAFDVLIVDPPLQVFQELVVNEFVAECGADV